MTEIDDVRVTRESYDELAELYDTTFRQPIQENPFDRAMLDMFAAAVGDAESGLVADLGCGPGRATRYLDELGLNVFGLDLSAEMIDRARAALPHLRFEIGSMEKLELADESLAGIVAWYSIIHTPPHRVPALLSEFARVIRPRGHALIAFQASDEARGIQEYDHKVAPSYRWAPDTLAATLEELGFTVTARLSRIALPDERTPQGCLLAVRN
ncbi:class I SAM-dependent methyltransferase [Nocardia sp. NBC_01503]|uniref:class I SAM-dependent DNA methyltransferase n=1 Tax=Nocardia sp. NBC_01503 TaxID=2975997 RepID=UPI002E7BE3E5|nr:methyltransferase domain-containing protein [Nocardia sp. NBC_01503]WTL34838.1 class I SAM-dependent methyltransferase [Nocardia sp. NBC_01503]